MAQSPTPPAAYLERLHGSALDDDVSFLLARATAAFLSAGNRALADHGLRVRSYSVLALACGARQPSQRDLASFLALDPSQVVSLVDELEKKGLVTRKPDPTDRRANIVVSTSEGRQVLVAAQDSIAQAEYERYSALTTKERDQFVRTLTKLAFDRP